MSRVVSILINRTREKKDGEVFWSGAVNAEVKHTPSASDQNQSQPKSPKPLTLAPNPARSF